MYSVCSVGTSYKIGVDGGGTKTECILVDARGEIVARHLAPGCNPSQVGPEKAREILTAALEALWAESKIENHLPGDGPDKHRAASTPQRCISHLHLYMAGNRTFWQETAATLTGFGTVIAAADSAPVLELATAGAPGLVIHAGTGSFIAARAPDGSSHYAGGLGWKFGDPGSGFDLGRRGLALALLELQSLSADEPSAARSTLATALCEHTGLTDYTANSRFFYNDPAANAQISAFAPRVLALAEADCGPAQQVVADSLTELARQADSVIHRLFPRPAGPLPCGISGRILNSEPGRYVMQSLASKLHWPVALQFIDTAPIEGVRRLLAKS